MKVYAGREVIRHSPQEPAWFCSTLSVMAMRPEALPEIRIQELRADSAAKTLADARELLLEYGQFVISRPGTAGFCYGSLEQEAAGLPSSYLEQQGGCLLATHGDASVGFVAWRVLPSLAAIEAWELKRLWVRPAGRGLGMGKALTEAVLDRAVAAGRRAIFLDTVVESMGAAYRLYRQLGFQKCEAYNDNPVDGLTYLVKYL